MLLAICPKSVSGIMALIPLYVFHWMTSTPLLGDDCDITVSLGGHTHSKNWQLAIAT